MARRGTRDEQADSLMDLLGKSSSLFATASAAFLSAANSNAQNGHSIISGLTKILAAVSLIANYNRKIAEGKTQGRGEGSATTASKPVVGTAAKPPQTESKPAAAPKPQQPQVNQKAKLQPIRVSNSGEKSVARPQSAKRISMTGSQALLNQAVKYEDRAKTSVSNQVRQQRLSRSSSLLDAAVRQEKLESPWFSKRNSLLPKTKIDALEESQKRIRQITSFVQTARTEPAKLEAKRRLAIERDKASYLDDLNRGINFGARQKAIRKFGRRIGETKEDALFRLYGEYEKHAAGLEKGRSGGILSADRYNRQRALLDKEYREKKEQITGNFASFNGPRNDSFIKKFSQKLVTSFRMFGGGKHTEQGGEGVPGGDNRRELEGLNRTQEFVNRFGAKFSAGVSTFTTKTAKSVGLFVKGIGKFAGPAGAILTGAAVLGQQYLKSQKIANQIDKSIGERGRTLRGMNIDFGDMAKAIRIGRNYGISQDRMMSSTVQMQGQLLQSIWGRGDLTTRLGEWGLSPFKDGGRGGVLSPHELRMAISQKLNELIAQGGTQLGAQFLNAQGIAPDEWRMYLNYAKDAKKAGFKPVDDITERMLGKADDVTRFSELQERHLEERRQKREAYLRQGAKGSWKNFWVGPWEMFDDMKARWNAADELEHDQDIARVQKEGKLRMGDKFGWNSLAVESLTSGGRDATALFSDSNIKFGVGSDTFAKALKQVKDIGGMDVTWRDLQGIKLDDKFIDKMRSTDDEGEKIKTIASMIMQHQDTTLGVAGVEQKYREADRKKEENKRLNSGNWRAMTDEERRDTSLKDKYDSLGTELEKKAFIEKHGNGFLDIGERTKDAIDFSKLKGDERKVAIKKIAEQIKKENETVTITPDGKETISTISEEEAEDRAYDARGIGFADRDYKARKRLIDKARKHIKEEAAKSGMELTAKDEEDYLQLQYGITKEQLANHKKSMPIEDKLNDRLEAYKKGEKMEDIGPVSEAQRKQFRSELIAKAEKGEDIGLGPDVVGMSATEKITSIDKLVDEIAPKNGTKRKGGEGGTRTRKKRKFRTSRSADVMAEIAEMRQGMPNTSDISIVQDKEAEAIATTAKAQEATRIAAESGNAMLKGGPESGKATHTEGESKTINQTLNQKVEIVAEKGVNIEELSETIVAKTSQMAKAFYGAMASYANAQEA